MSGIINICPRSLLLCVDPRLLHLLWVLHLPLRRVLELLRGGLRLPHVAQQGVVGLILVVVGVVAVRLVLNFEIELKCYFFVTPGMCQVKSFQENGILRIRSSLAQRKAVKN